MQHRDREAQEGSARLRTRVLLLALVLLGIVVVTAFIAGLRADDFVRGVLDSLRATWPLTVVGGGAVLVVVGQTMVAAMRETGKK